MNYRNVALVAVILIVVLCQNVQAQYLERIETKSLSLSTGDLRTDLMMMPDAGSLLNSVDSSKVTIRNNKYSPLRAGLYSAVIPGAGQFYTKSYLQSALFAGAEVAMWIIYSKYQTKGDQQTQDFQNYADEHWSVVRYVQWIQTQGANGHYGTDALPSVAINSDESLKSWLRVNWVQVNALEDYLGNLLTSGIRTGFSHKLPPYGDQQYYELIGKYPQFLGGWDDAGIRDYQSVLDANVSDRFLLYRDMRGDANSYYGIATAMTYVLVANHVLSALEAAWNAAHLNSQLHASSSVQPRNVDGYHVELTYTMNMQVEF
jgi:hypothetical protein